MERRLLILLLAFGLFFLPAPQSVEHVNRGRVDKNNTSRETTGWSFGMNAHVTGAESTGGNPRVRPAIEWLNGLEFVTYRGCGTECEAVYLFSRLGGYQRKLYYGVNHTWSPDGRYVLAYHRALQLGVTVGDKGGQTLLTIRRDYPNTHSWFSSPQAAWSPDSSEVAVIINKTGQADLELLVYDIEDTPRVVLRRGLSSREFSLLHWKDDRTVAYYEGAEEKVVFL